MSIESFNFNNLNDSIFNLAIIGKTGDGKTVLLKHILNHIKNSYHFIYLFTSNSHTEQYDNYIWKNHKFYFTEKSVFRFKIQDHINWLETKKDKNKIKTLFIFDDVGDIIRNELYTFLISSRHVNNSFILLMHNITDLNKNERLQLDYKIFTSKPEKNVFENLDKTSIEKIYSKISSIYVDVLTKKYLIIDKNYDIFYYIINVDDLNKIINNQINILNYSYSLYKSILISKIKDVIKNMKDNDTNINNSV